jgi:hypothetical protein
MPAAYVVALVIAASVLTALLVALIMRRSMTIAAARLRETGVEPLREANVELERRFLLEQQKAARVAELEPVLAERVREAGSLSEAKAAAEGQLATAAEARRLSLDGRYSSIVHLQATAHHGVPKIRALYETTYFAGLRTPGMPEE